MDSQGGALRGHHLDSCAMGATAAVRRGPVDMARVTLLLSVLGGLFAMHVLGVHGTMHHESVAHPAGDGAGSHTTRMASASDAPAATGLIRTTAAAPVQAEAPAGHLQQLQHMPPDGPGMGIGGLCLAVLGGLLLLASLWRRRSRTSWTPTASIHATLHRLTSGHRDRDPPSLIRLAINRC